MSSVQTSLTMAPPTPLLLKLTAGGLCMLIVIFLPELLPNTKLISLYLIPASLIFSAWAIGVVIYPKFASSLRHLPQPKVNPLTKSPHKNPLPNPLITNTPQVRHNLRNQLSLHRRAKTKSPPLEFEVEGCGGSVRW